MQLFKEVIIIILYLDIHHVDDLGAVHLNLAVHTVGLLTYIDKLGRLFIARDCIFMFNLIASTVGTNNENMNFGLNILMSHILPGTSRHKNREIHMYTYV